jgi:hypothetical protein
VRKIEQQHDVRQNKNGVEMEMLKKGKKNVMIEIIMEKMVLHVLKSVNE